MLIVAGITRSGLSLTMQMLDAGGYPCAGEFPAYEEYPIGEIPWEDLEGRAVKLVDAQNQFPPDGKRYRVIRLRRNRSEQARSLNKWVSTFFGQSAPISVWLGSLRRDYETIDKWAAQHDVLVMDFEQLITDPRAASLRLVEWLGQPLDIDAMVKAVIPRGVECYPTLLEEQLVARIP